MKQIHLVAKAFLFALIAFFFQGFSNRPGGDYYKVLLNNKLITEQFLYKPYNVKTLALTASNNKDHLSIYYTHCGMAGTQRTISLKAPSGKILGRWNFSDSKTMEMQLAVKDVIKVSGTSSSASLYYASKEIPSDKELITVDFSNRATAKL